MSPSLTTYSDRIPEYRVMDVDYDSLQVLDYSQYHLDLRKFTSKEDQPVFELLYTFKQAFNISDMRVDSGLTELRNKLRDEP